MQESEADLAYFKAKEPNGFFVPALSYGFYKGGSTAIARRGADIQKCAKAFIGGVTVEKAIEIASFNLRGD
ncbi:hypothetical protein E1162_10330 [Rhodobacteraceae bacterium RKSG542]|uniref:hypothetical protein n=1 Tax=Pseudovibrio flavus TaxID=2529854 RepID=UPI0012BB8CD5|nr:hypothetical protein [Pseudovibrio flavus]MTI17636.1 hypothetical protein [Pseudovibrio flavus]